MRYEYKCDKCDTTTTINKPMKDYGQVEKCPVCDTVMSRVYAVGISTSDGYKS